MKRITGLLLALVLAVLCLAACTLDEPTPEGQAGKVTPKNRVFYEYFDTVCVFYDYTGGTAAEFSAACALVEEELSLCHRLFDIYNAYDGVTNIKSINDAAGGAPLAVDERIIDLLTLSKEMYTKTGGEVNVAMGAVLSIWHDRRTEAEADPASARVPTSKELLAAAEHTSIDSLEINAEAGTVRLTDPDASLDVGAIAKGYAAERVAALLEAEGITAYALDFGGNLRVGEKLDGSGFTSGIRNPYEGAANAYARTLTVKNSALVTSGVDQRFYTVEGVRYHHIINKDTLYPENNYLSVSIHTASSAVADALSTALFNMTLAEAQAALDRIGGTEATFVLPNGEVTVLSSAA